MQKYTPEQIASQRDKFLESKYTEVDVNIRGRAFSYFVLPQSLNERLPHFVYIAEDKIF
ncbi:MAG: hypothetical protein Q8P57_01095 [Candidatus Pacearchaeota archaeon]|nr:hypothetical protein [Candidatus Pacearchaeota archaeon]